MKQSKHISLFLLSVQKPKLENEKFERHRSMLFSAYERMDMCGVKCANYLGG